MPKRLVVVVLLVLFGSSMASRAALSTLSRDPYLGAIVVDAASGRVLFEDSADAVGYPASVLKLMDLLIILEKVDQGALRLDDKVTISAEASKIGGSQVYLAEKEVFTIDELLYALMIQSANDAATALAIHVAGSRDGFVQLMNEKARALGMTHTQFSTVHGLPPSAGQEPDRTTARDLSILGRELARHPDVFRYTSTQVRGFRNNTFEMRNHNKLLGTVAGVDGFKTGYFGAAGFSMVVTAQRDGVRIIAVVLGSVSRPGRDAKASELLAKGFLAMPRAPAASVAAAVLPVAPAAAAPVVGVGEEEEADTSDVPEERAGTGGGWWKFAAGFLSGVVVTGAGWWALNRRPRDDRSDLFRR